MLLETKKMTSCGLLRGYVIDDTTLKRIAGVKVTIGDIVVTTDENGFYEIKRIPSGNYTIIYVAHGYMTQQWKVHIREGDNNFEILEAWNPQYRDEFPNIYLQRSVVQGKIRNTQIWNEEIHIIGNVEVPTKATLIIKPGTVVRFKHFRYGYTDPLCRLSLIVKDGGKLIAIGTPEKPIWFTSDADEPINGDWSMIRFIDNSVHSIMNYCIVEFAQQGINMWNSSPK